jgi:hypothetical protein
MAGVFDFDIDDGMRRQEDAQSDEDVDIEIQGPILQNSRLGRKPFG